jgi:hypothetical protein
VSATDVIAVGSLVIGGWGAWTAHKARQWQRARDEERRTTRVRIDFAHRTGPGGPDRELLYTVTLLAINDGESTEYVTAAFLQQPGELEGQWGLRVFGDEGHEGTEPHELRPRGVLRVPTDLDSDGIAAFRDGFVGIVWLGSGEEVTSDLERLNDDLLDTLEGRG